MISAACCGQPLLPGPRSLAPRSPEAAHCCFHVSALQGEPGDLFYIIKEGEAVVYQDTGGGSRKRVNQLFKADFFGEGALLSDEPRWGLGWVLTNSRCKHLFERVRDCVI